MNISSYKFFTPVHKMYVSSTSQAFGQHKINNKKFFCTNNKTSLKDELSFWATPLSIRTRPIISLQLHLMILYLTALYHIENTTLILTELFWEKGIIQEKSTEPRIWGQIHTLYLHHCLLEHMDWSFPPYPKMRSFIKCTYTLYIYL